MPASWQPAAVRAQAVAARTYAAFDRAAHTTRYYDTCDTTSCQVYGGVGDEDSRSNAAVDATAGKVLHYGGQAGVHAVQLQQRWLAVRPAASPTWSRRPTRTTAQRQPDAHLEPRP